MYELKRKNVVTPTKKKFRETFYKKYSIIL